MPKITTLLFDCDNTLVLSEALAFEACADLANEILHTQSKPKTFTGPELQSTFIGQNFRGMMTSLQKQYEFQIPDDEFEKYVTLEEDRVIQKLEEKAVACDGVDDVLKGVFNAGRYEMAVVSSSALRRVRAAIKKVGQEQYFDEDKVFSAANSLERPTSKPDPAIYLHACKVLGKKPEECVAIEDSSSGVKSAVTAGIWVVGYVGSYGEEEQKEMEGGLRKAGAKFVMSDWREFEDCLQRIEAL